MIDVTCAIIIKEDKILAVQRSETMKHPLKWEFPGGKVEKGESAEVCIIRELHEELDIKNIKITRKLPVVKYHYGEKSIRLIPFEVKPESDNINLKEHIAYRYLSIEQIYEPDWLDADLLIIDIYMNLIENKK